jgi:hypothetical protein
MRQWLLSAIAASKFECRIISFPIFESCVSAQMWSFEDQSFFRLGAK